MPFKERENEASGQPNLMKNEASGPVDLIFLSTYAFHIFQFSTDLGGFETPKMKKNIFLFVPRNKKT